MSLLEDIASLLDGDSVAVPGVTLFVSSSAAIPVGVGPFITISETGGLAPTRVQNQTAAKTQRPAVQILVRAGGGALAYPAAREMAREAYQSLDGRFNVTVNGVFYLSITARQEPTDMGLDTSGRAQVVFNIDVEKEPS